jgi:hypothetical protein
MNINDMIKKAEECVEYHRNHGDGLPQRYKLVLDGIYKLIAAMAEELKNMRGELAAKEHSVGFLEGLLEETKEELKKREWMPIASAPKDGTEILGFMHKKRIELIWFFAASSHTQNWLDTNGEIVNPTHWQPLPPTETTEE